MRRLQVTEEVRVIGSLVAFTLSAVAIVWLSWRIRVMDRRRDAERARLKRYAQESSADSFFADRREWARIDFDDAKQWELEQRMSDREHSR